MSSLGDLLLAHLKPNKADKVSDSDSCDDNANKTDDIKNNEESDQAHQHPTVFPGLIEKNENIEETQSNASSTDDYVRELLDPDDRPRNVWHVVQGPKVQPGGNDDRETDDQEIPPPPSPPPPPSEDGGEENEQKFDRQSLVDRTSSRLRNSVDRHSGYSDQELDRRDVDQHNDDESGQGVDRRNDEYHHRDQRDIDEKKSEKSTDGRHRDRRDRSRERSSSSRRNHHRSHHSDRDRERNRDRDSNRSRRKRDNSDDETTNDRRHRRSSRDRHRDRADRRRSRSRSRASSSKRRDRSRSNSQSPLTKRNSRTILIMQLNPRINSRDLEEFFSDIGKVREVRLIMDSRTRRHKGIAYIEFEDASSAAKAFALNGQKFFGAPMVIQSAQIDRQRSSSDWLSSTSQSVNHHASSHSSSRSHLPPNSYRIYVGSLNINLTEEMLRSVFEPFGTIIRLELIKDRVTNISKGYAFITYANIEDGQSAVEALDGLELGGKAMRVSKSTEKSERAPMANSTTTDVSGSTGKRSHHNHNHHHNDSDSDGRSSKKDVTASLYELAGH